MKIHSIFYNSYNLLYFIVIFNGYLILADEIQQNKNGRFLSMFEIINFPNDACTGDSSKNGTCYTSAECEEKGGEKAGDCAQGYGVCCTFEVECGSSVTQNNTYFKKPSSFSTGNCAVQVCPGEDICQLRLDFSSFAITGPYTSTDSAADAQNWANGVIDPKTGVAVVPLQGQCTKDTFTVTSPGGSSVPVICGENNNEHIYVDTSSGECNSIAFAIDPSTASSSWNVQIQMYECDYENLAPRGCTQYFFGEDNGKFSTFNWSGGNHLANQNQNICFRKESGKTKICYSTVSSYTDFSVTNTQAAGVNTQKNFVGTQFDKGGCCGYGATPFGGAANGGQFDCLQIPDATDGNDRCVWDTDGACAIGAFCGPAGIFTQGGKQGGTLPDAMETVCSKRVPFQVRFISDSNENGANEVGLSKGLKGFQLAYIQS